MATTQAQASGRGIAGGPADNATAPNVYDLNVTDTGGGTRRVTFTKGSIVFEVDLTNAQRAALAAAL